MKSTSLSEPAPHSKYVRCWLGTAQVFTRLGKGARQLISRTVAGNRAYLTGGSCWVDCCKPDQVLMCSIAEWQLRLSNFQDLHEVITEERDICQIQNKTELTDNRHDFGKDHVGTTESILKDALGILEQFNSLVPRKALKPLPFVAWRKKGKRRGDWREKEIERDDTPFPSSLSCFIPSPPSPFLPAMQTGKLSSFILWVNSLWQVQALELETYKYYIIFLNEFNIF